MGEKKVLVSASPVGIKGKGKTNLPASKRVELNGLHSYPN